EREALASDRNRNDMTLRIRNTGVAIAETDDQLADDVLDEVIVRLRDPLALQLFLRKRQRRDEEIREHLLHRRRLRLTIGDGDRAAAIAQQQAVVKAEVTLERI